MRKIRSNTTSFFIIALLTALVVIVSGPPEARAITETTTTITSDDPDPSVVGEDYVVNITVSSDAGTPTGIVFFEIVEDEKFFTAVLTDGEVSIPVSSLSAGEKTLTARYGGDANFAPSGATESHTVNPADEADTTTTITSDLPDPSMVGQNYTVNVTVSSAAGAPSGTVDVDDGGENVCVIALVGGAGSCTLPSTSAGIKTLTASYGGDADFDPSSDTESHTVIKASTTTTITADEPDPSVVGQNYTVDVTVSSVIGTPTGIVTVNDFTGPFCTITLVGGSGSCTLSSTSAGDRTLVARYRGDAVFNVSQDIESHTVIEAGTTTTITSDEPDPSMVGQDYTVNVTVSSAAGAPSGTVDVDDGGENVCMIALVGGSGSCTLPSTSAGDKTLMASYGGDADFNVSQDTESHTVLTTQQAIDEFIINEVQDLVVDGVLNNGQGNSLISKLENAIKKLDQGKTAPAIDKLEAFIDQVNDLINDGVLTPAQGQPLIDAATDIIALLNPA